jgi:general secretion pathway protein B
VTGIAWQNDSASSVAMVNGRPVQQGATVDGYKVEQIYEDKVRFSGANGRVEIPLGGGE